MRTLHVFILGIILMLSCSTTSNSGKADSKSGKADSTEYTNLTNTEFVNTNLDLTSQLRLLPGVMIRGEAETASFQVRGAQSISSNTEPLFILNGRAFEDYSTVYRMVNPLNFKSAKVLKNASEIAFYGSRGANGVIVIETK